MKTSKKIFGIILLGIMIFFIPSCTSKKEKSATIYYYMGFDNLNTSDLSEVSLIENAYKKALGVSDNQFSLEGKISECNQKVIQSCREAEEKLKSDTLKGSYTFVVTNANSSETIYTKTLK